MFRRFLIIGLLATKFALLAAAEERIDEASAFLIFMMERFHELEPEACIKPLKNEFGFSSGPSEQDCEHTQTYLHNVFEDYLLSQKDHEREEVVTRFLGVMTAAADQSRSDNRDLSDRIVVQLRPQSYLDFVRNETDKEIVARPFHGDLYAVIMRDSADALSSVPPEDLDEIGLTEDDAFNLAMKNLPLRMGTIHTENIDGVILTASENDLANGLPFQNDACVPGGEDVAYFLFDRYQFLSAPIADDKAWENLVALFTSMVDAGESMSETLIICVGGEWTHARLSDPDTQDTDR